MSEIERLSTMSVEEALTDEAILNTREVMRQLRPAIQPDAYLDTVRPMMRTDGYHLAALYESGRVRSVAGYRFMEMLYADKIMYVDDLNTDEAHRSQGCGRVLMTWLKARARAHGCGQLHLDSGVQREATHRYYFRERFTINAYHFRVDLA